MVEDSEEVSLEAATLEKVRNSLLVKIIGPVNGRGKATYRYCAIATSDG